MMRDFDPETFEADLASLKPVKMPEQLSADLAWALTRTHTNRRTPACSSGVIGWLRWAIPTAVLAGLMVFFILGWRGKPFNKPRQITSRSSPVSILKPDAVLLSQELVANF